MFGGDCDTRVLGNKTVGGANASNRVQEVYRSSRTEAKGLFRLLFSFSRDNLRDNLGNDFLLPFNPVFSCLFTLLSISSTRLRIYPTIY